MAKPWTSPYYEGRSPWTSESCLNGQKLATEIAHWIEKHPVEFNGLFRIVKDMQKLHIKGCVRDRVRVEAMVRGIEVESDDAKFAHAYWAGISRYMVMLDPSLKGNPIEFKRSDIDNYGLVPIDIACEYGHQTYSLEKAREQ